MYNQVSGMVKYWCPKKIRNKDIPAKIRNLKRRMCFFMTDVLY